MANNTTVIKDVFGPCIIHLIMAQTDLNRLRKTKYSLLLLLLLRETCGLQSSWFLLA